MTKQFRQATEQCLQVPWVQRIYSIHFSLIPHKCLLTKRHMKVWNKEVRMKDQWQLLWDRIVLIPTYKPSQLRSITALSQKQTKPIVYSYGIYTDRQIFPIYWYTTSWWLEIVSTFVTNPIKINRLNKTPQISGTQWTKQKSKRTRGMETRNRLTVTEGGRG